MGMASDKLVPELRHLASGITGQVARARSSKDGYTIHQFISTDRIKENAGLVLLYPVREYVRCFRALGVKNKEELDQLCKQHYGEPAVREAVEELLSSEEEFGEFVSKLDEEMKIADDASASKSILRVGSHVPAGLDLLDVDSNNKVSLGAVLQKARFTLLVFKRHYA